MTVDLITKIEHFEQLRANWQSVYEQDANTQVFISWAWLHGWFQATQNQMAILAYRPAGSATYTAFLPLAFQARKRSPVRVLHMAGNSMADHTGMLSLPQNEAEAIAAFAECIANALAWDRCELKDVLDPRMEALLQHFVPDKFEVIESERLSCPAIQLPESSWEQYFLEYVSAKTRSNIRYYQRKLEALEGFKTTYVNEENLDRSLDALLALWQMRWGLPTDGLAEIFHACFHNDQLWLGIFWEGENPIAALSGFIDKSKGFFGYFISGFDPKYGQLRPGRVMVAHSICYAIEHGFRTYDFLRGDEPYKFSFGAEERFNMSYVLRRKTLRSSLLFGAEKLATNARSVLSSRSASPKEQL